MENNTAGRIRVGAKLKIVDCICGHRFEIGEVVEAIYHQYSDADHTTAKNKKGLLGSLIRNEFEILPDTPLPTSEDQEGLWQKAIRGAIAMYEIGEHVDQIAKRCLNDFTIHRKEKV